MKKHIYRVGDKIRIVNPRFILRVGYPLVFKDLIPEFESHPNLQKAMRLLLLNESEQTKDSPILEDLYPTFSPRGKVARDFIAGVAKAANRMRGFGGPDRQIFTEELPYVKDQIVDVLGKRTVKTGKYFPPSHYVSYEGEHYYEAGGLSDEKIHILLSTTYGEIEETDVEPV